MRIYENLLKHNMRYPIHSSIVQLTTYDGGLLRNQGTIQIPIRFGDQTNLATFYIVDTNGPAILGLPSSRDLKLITIHCSITQNKLDLERLRREFLENFEGTADFPGSSTSR